MGGDDSEENLIPLFPEEHLVTHLLLVKIYPNNNKLIYAANMMSLDVKEYMLLFKEIEKRIEVGNLRVENLKG